MQSYRRGRESNCILVLYVYLCPSVFFSLWQCHSLALSRIVAFSEHIFFTWALPAQIQGSPQPTINWIDTVYQGRWSIRSIYSWAATFPKMWYVRPVKPQFSLCICAVWSEPLQVAWIFYECKVSDWTTFGVSELKRRLHRLVWVYTCQNGAVLEITCRGSWSWNIELCLRNPRISQVIDIFPCIYHVFAFRIFFNIWMKLYNHTTLKFDVSKAVCVLCLPYGAVGLSTACDCGIFSQISTFVYTWYL